MMGETTTLNPSKRRKRNARVATPRPMRETEGDRQIVRLVYDYRILSQTQLEQLLGKSRSTMQQSLVRLYDHRYLERVFLPIAELGSSPALYILDKRGIEVLQRQGVADFTGVPDKDISLLFMEHTLAINRFRIAITQACEQIGWKITTWQTENEVKADYDKVMVKGRGSKPKTIPIVPDSYFVIEAPDKGLSHLFLELDRGTMTLERFRAKVEGYLSYYKQGGYEKRYHAKGFRVVTVVDTPKDARVANLAAHTAKLEGIGRRFWFAHLPAITPETVLTQAIWTVAGDTRPATLFKFDE